MASRSQYGDSMPTLASSSLPDSSSSDPERIVLCCFRKEGSITGRAEGCGRWFKASEMVDTSQHNAICRDCFFDGGGIYSSDEPMRSESDDSILSAGTLRMANPTMPVVNNPQCEPQSGSKAKRSRSQHELEKQRKAAKKERMAAKKERKAAKKPDQPSDSD
eukprot:7536591-Pyramimonas_sp.AAC.1